MLTNLTNLIKERKTNADYLCKYHFKKCGTEHKKKLSYIHIFQQTKNKPCFFLMELKKICNLSLQYFIYEILKFVLSGSHFIYNKRQYKTNFSNVIKIRIGLTYILIIGSNKLKQSDEINF